MTKKTTKGFHSKKQGKYPASYINDLRQRVEATCRALQPSRYFDFYSSKQSTSYTELDNLLMENGYPEINTATMHNFFNKQSSQSKAEKGEYLGFHERTVEIFESFAGLLFSNQNENISSNLDDDDILGMASLTLSKQDAGLKSAIGEMLNKLYLSQKATCEAESHLTVYENGKVVISFKVFLTALSDIYNLRLNVFADHIIFIESVSAREVLTNKTLPILPYQVNEKSYIGYIILTEPIKKDTNYIYQYDVSVRNYFKDLFEKKICHEQRFIVNNRYKSLKDVFRFPDTTYFKNVSVTITKHPDQKCIGKKLSLKKIGEYKVFSFQNNTGVYEAQTLIEYEISI